MISEGSVAGFWAGGLLGVERLGHQGQGGTGSLRREWVVFVGVGEGRGADLVREGRGSSSASVMEGARCWCRGGGRGSSSVSGRGALIADVRGAVGERSLTSFF
ncbi:hypothetical protein TIFTF001_001000 [Ficus carica]|uniref:Uncharacterized protein n=1 Tax=Ficus carica TaxID=3494 RepID=A0AA87ZG10_FICCA|nr:hypothetical protein TIFTF001_001000 [Ficus carica]